MIERTASVHPRIRAGSVEADRPSVPARTWIKERAPRLRSLARERHRREQAWAWLSLVTLIVCWDASSRLGERVSPPRPKFAHVVEEDEFTRTSGTGFSVDL